MKLKNKLKLEVLRLSYWLAYRLAAAAVYTRQPFVRYPYMNPPSELLELRQQLLGVQAPGAAVEIGCNQGWTTCFLLEALRECGMKRDYVCIDTFNGFTAEDVRFECRVRGKTDELYDGFFLINDPVWLEASLTRFGYQNAVVKKADATKFDYGSLGPIAFALVDVDLYRPVRASLEQLLPNMACGGMVMVDDCDARDERWDGAHQAYMEFCTERSIRPEFLCRKFGIIRT
jgi:O-methyltransferase